MQAISTMPVNRVQSHVCYITVLADAGSCLQSESTGTSASSRMLTAVNLTATGVTVNKHFLMTHKSLHKTQKSKVGA